jgi:hypothetical protein
MPALSGPAHSIRTYGVGFGGVAPNIPPEVIPTVATQSNAQVRFQFGPATRDFIRALSGWIGFGQPLAQTLYLTVKR